MPACWFSSMRTPARRWRRTRSRAFRTSSSSTPASSRLYVAIGDPGVIEVFDTAPLARRETVQTEPGAHTLSFDAARNIVCAFLPQTHRAAVYEDGA